MDAGERSDSPAGAEQADTVALLRKHVGEAREGVPRALAHPFVGGDPVRALEMLAALALGQGNHAPRRAPPGADPRSPFFLVDQHQLGRAAADVEDQRGPVAWLEQFVAAEHREPGFLLRPDDVEDDSGLATHPLGELGAVGGTAASFGRDRPRDRYVPPAKLVRAHRQRADRPVHRLFRKLAVLRQTLAEANDPGEGVDNGEPALARTGDQQAAVVSSEIDRAIGMAVDFPPPRPRLRRPALLSYMLESRRTGDTLRHDTRPFLFTARFRG